MTAYDINLTEDKGRKPKLKAPPNACETHSHVHGPLDRYSQDRQPLRFAPVEVYRDMLDRIGVKRCVIVQSSYYGFDNTCTLDAIVALGQDRARGTAVIKPDTPKAEIQRLHKGGIRGVRIAHGSDDLTPETAADLARAIAPFGWVLQFQDKRSDWIEANIATLAALPVPVIFDHLGRTPPKEGVNSSEFKAMMKVFEKGNAWIKLSGFYYNSMQPHPGHEDLHERIRVFLDARPDRLLWGLNWPFPDFPGPGEPDSADFLDQLLDFVPDEKTRNMILADNPGTLYGFDG